MYIPIFLQTYVYIGHIFFQDLLKVCHINVIWKKMIVLEAITLQTVIFPVDTCVSSTLGGTLFPQE